MRRISVADDISICEPIPAEGDQIGLDQVSDGLEVVRRLHDAHEFLCRAGTERAFCDSTEVHDDLPMEVVDLVVEVFDRCQRFGRPVQKRRHHIGEHGLNPTRHAK